MSRSCPPPSPPATSGCPGCALGWRRAGESGRVFPPPLGQASERAPPSASLPRQSGSGARPPAFSPTSATRRLWPGSQSRLDRRPGRRVQIRASELQSARGAEWRQHGKWGAPGARVDSGVGPAARALFPRDLGQAAAPRQPSFCQRSGLGCQGAACAQVSSNSATEARSCGFRDRLARAAGGAGSRLCSSLQSLQTRFP